MLSLISYTLSLVLTLNLRLSSLVANKRMVLPTMSSKVVVLPVLADSLNRHRHKPSPAMMPTLFLSSWPMSHSGYWVSTLPILCSINTWAFGPATKVPKGVCRGGKPDIIPCHSSLAANAWKPLRSNGYTSLRLPWFPISCRVVWIWLNLEKLLCPPKTNSFGNGLCWILFQRFSKEDAKLFTVGTWYRISRSTFSLSLTGWYR